MFDSLKYIKWKWMVFIIFIIISFNSFCFAYSIKETHPRIWLTDELLTELRVRASVNSPEWVALKNWCDSNLTTNISSDFNGFAWAEAVANFGLAYQVLKDSDPTTANQYADKGVIYLNALVKDLNNVGDGQGGLTPITKDSGYPIRSRGAFTALGYDWLYDYSGFTLQMKIDAYSQLNEWLNWYASSGYAHNTPIANYFTGYFLCKGLTAYTTYGDNPQASTHIEEIRNTMFETMVKSEYGIKLKGGDWPEGWNYGPGAVERIVEVLLAIKTATGEDLFTSFLWPKEVIYNRVHSLFPNRDYTYDGGSWTGSYRGNPTKTDMMILAHVFTGSRDAEYAQYYINHLNWLPIQPAKWFIFLFYDPDAPEKSPVGLPISYLSEGTGFVAMREKWDASPAVTWASLQCGPYLSAQGSQNRDQGHFRIYKYDQLAVDAAIASPGWVSPYETDKHNTFLIDDAGEGIMNYPPGQGYWGENVSINKFEDSGGYVYVKCNFADAYKKNTGENAVTGLSRQFIFIRADYIVILDKISTLKNYYTKKWQVHFKNEPTIDGDTTIGTNGEGRLFVKTLLPEGFSLSKASDSDVGATTWRVNVVPSILQQSDMFLNVLFATKSITPSMPQTIKIDASTNNMIGAHIKDSSKNYVVMFSSDPNGADVTGTITYTIEPTANSQHFLFNLPPNTAYDVTVVRGTQTITVTATSGSGSYRSSSQGVLTFDISNIPPSKPSLIYPSNGATGIPTSVTFKWSKSTDPDGDTVTYKLYYVTKQYYDANGFTGVTPIEPITASIYNRNRLYASTFGFLGTSLFFGFVAIGISSKRKRIALFFVTTIIFAGLFVVNCGGGGGGGAPASISDDSVSYSVSGLQSSTTYYWKVVADDGQGGQTSSYTWSFTTD